MEKIFGEYKEYVLTDTETHKCMICGIKKPIYKLHKTLTGKYICRGCWEKQTDGF